MSRYNDERLSELFDLLTLAERAANRLGVHEGDHVEMQRAAEITWFFEAVAEGRYREGRRILRGLAARDYIGP